MKVKSEFDTVFKCKIMDEKYIQPFQGWVLFMFYYPQFHWGY